MVDRLAEIDSVFCIDICAYAIMSNHYHLVLYINKQAVENLTDLEVIERWRKLYKGPEIIERYLKGEQLSTSHHLLINEIIEKWRDRLSDISWFMRCLNEFIARKANSEDKCTGRFWEGRFKSQALLDEHALLTCMAYVELNPIRAKMAYSPETSDFTSIKQRIEEQIDNSITETITQEVVETSSISLKAFIAEDDVLKDQIPYHLKDYLYLVDWSGRAIREGKKGAIDDRLPPILQRLGIDAEYWCDAMQPKGSRYFSRAIGCRSHLQEYAKKLEIGWIKGIRLCTKLFPA